MNIPAGAVVATAVLAGIARVARADLPEGYAVHDPEAEVGCAAVRPLAILSAFMLIPPRAKGSHKDSSLQFAPIDHGSRSDLRTSDPSPQVRLHTAASEYIDAFSYERHRA